ncbi:nucleoside deaminase [Notoacmeibacter marinus]|uniref:nucleoside deaminase n=1 Tax=Notoacmeibacter marinus TaxID=1876515 RepID=UPI0019661DFE|nr:nucleoside deaminase [Notoacmeibacter marinus]
MTIDPSARFSSLMEDTVAYALEHVRGGGIPFSAFVIAPDGKMLGRGVNRVREHCDPTAHAEVEAIRDACRTHETPYLRGATLLASGEPCAMCYTSALYAGISRVLFAVDRDEAAAHGFDYRGGYTLFETDPCRWSSPTAGKLAVPEGLAPFAAFGSSRFAR